jgi:hypothetical protein
MLNFLDGIKERSKISNWNLLIVDAEPVLLKIMKLNLIELADKVFTAGDGSEALHIMATQDVQCVI